MAVAATRPSAIFFMMVLLLVPEWENARGEMVFRCHTILVAGSTQKIIEQILLSYGTITFWNTWLSFTRLRRATLTALPHARASCRSARTGSDRDRDRSPAS